MRQSTERYLGCKQKLYQTVNDNLGIMGTDRSPDWDPDNQTDQRDELRDLPDSP